MLAQNTPKSLTKVSLVDTFLHSPQNLYFSSVVTSTSNDLHSSETSAGASGSIYSGQFRGLLFNNDAIFEKVITAHQE